MSFTSALPACNALLKTGQAKTTLRLTVTVSASLDSPTSNKENLYTQPHIVLIGDA